MPTIKGPQDVPPLSEPITEAMGKPLQKVRGEKALTLDQATEKAATAVFEEHRTAIPDQMTVTLQQPSESARQMVKGQIQSIDPNPPGPCTDCEPDVCQVSDCVVPCPCDCGTSEASPGDQGWAEVLNGRMQIVDGRIEQLHARFDNLEIILKKVSEQLAKQNVR